MIAEVLAVDPGANENLKAAQAILKDWDLKNRL